MLQWIPYAMVRISLFFIGGILAAIYLPDLFSISWAVGASLFLIIFYLFGYAFLKKYRSVLGLLGLTIIFFFGFAQLTLYKDIRNANHLIHVRDTIEAYTAIVRSYPESKSKSWKIEVELEAIKTNHWQSASGRIQVYISKKENAWNGSYGDMILVKGSPQLLQPPANPGEFDFKRFLTFRNIHHQHFLRKGDFEVVDEVERKGFIYYSQEARKWATKKIETFIDGEQEQAIAMALILGVTDGIDTDLVNAYSASGAMHVLAVSGLHVGIIYVLILFLLKPIASQSWSRWLIAIISLICLWAFAFVTGLSPSVLRAVTMFSFIAVARPFGVRTNIYNTLAASAFVLLLFNPYLIMSVGFQLSYLAVIGIVYLQQPIYRLLEFDSWLGNWTWQITCISIAAQLTTFSLGLLYFHQFPVYFLVSNLFVIPLSTGILIVGIVLLALQFISPVANILGWLLEYLIKLLNWIVFKVEEMPFSLVTNIELTTFQCWLLMFILAAIILLMEVKSIQWLYVAFGLTILFSFTQWSHYYSDIQQTELVVYRVNGHTAIDIIHHGKAVFIADSALLHDQERMRFHITPNRLQRGVTHITANLAGFQKKGVEYFHVLGKTIALVTSSESELPLSGYVNYLVVSNNARPPKEPRTDFKVDQLILDSSNSRWCAQQWKRWAGKLPAHDVSVHQAFVVNL